MVAVAAMSVAILAGAASEAICAGFGLLSPHLLNGRDEKGERVREKEAEGKA